MQPAGSERLRMPLISHDTTTPSMAGQTNDFLAHALFNAEAAMIAQQYERAGEIISAVRHELRDRALRPVDLFDIEAEEAKEAVGA